MDCICWRRTHALSVNYSYQLFRTSMALTIASGFLSIRECGSCLLLNDKPHSTAVDWVDTLPTHNGKISTRSVGIGFLTDACQQPLDQGMICISRRRVS